ncbi:MAG: hypothetical protein U1E34_10145 [Amaricoccus sp.]
MVLWETFDDRQDAVSAVAAVAALGGCSDERRVIEAVQALSGRLLPVRVGLKALGAVEVSPGWWGVSVEWPSDEETAAWRKMRRKRK